MEYVKGRRSDGSMLAPSGAYGGGLKSEGGGALAPSQVGDNKAAMAGLAARYPSTASLPTNPNAALNRQYQRAVRDASNLKDLGAMVRGRQALKNGLGDAWGSAQKTQARADIGLRERQARVDQDFKNKFFGKTPTTTASAGEQAAAITSDMGSELYNQLDAYFGDTDLTLGNK